MQGESEIRHRLVDYLDHADGQWSVRSTVEDQLCPMI
jgi:hypothetical protein